VWELIFMMLILKIPIVYLCLVVYWAIRAEPEPPEPAVMPAVLPQPEPLGPRHDRRPRPTRPRALRPRPHGGPSRGYARTTRVRASR
jgi:hypothetical protein